MTKTYELIDERMPGRKHYKLNEPIVWKEYMPLTDSWEERLMYYFVVSLGRHGDTALFPAEADGSITEFDALHTKDTWIVDYDGFIQEWLEKEGRK